MIIAQVCLRLATIKSHSKMCSFITQHNATDVAILEGACNWHADCRNVLKSCWLWIECSFLYHKRFREFGSTSNRPHNRRPCVTTPAQDIHIQHIYPQDRLRPARIPVFNVQGRWQTAVWRCVGEQFADVNVVDRVTHGGCGVMVQAGIC